ncbi:hypothetical protein [Polynucleobacter sp. P1-05-14]|uniref:hypothetical protein n=1 Tax=Polynucleobacter sp. P1-05-14 TaxID=1819732 RepID=UPI001C0E32A4|nr:hypothetical protein [Polynucleobacter sp. P1-05-14]MBU3547498.1 hypothetical protein [Polynucleobacter sp. P1-05-14]
MKKIVILFLAIGLAGCMTWYKPNARQGEFEQARYECLQQSQQAGGVAQVNASGGYAVSGVRTNDMLFASCMNAKGWSWQSKDSAQAAVAQSQMATAGAQSQVQSEMSQIKARQQATCSNPDFKLYYAKSSCLAEDMTFEQLADSTKITPAQKAVLVKQREAVASQQKDQMEINRRLFGAQGAKVADLAQSTLIPQNDKNNLDLYNGKITWGEYNQKRKEIAATFSAAVKNIR